MGVNKCPKQEKFNDKKSKYVRGNTYQQWECLTVISVDMLVETHPDMSLKTDKGKNKKIQWYNYELPGETYVPAQVQQVGEL